MGRTAQFTEVLFETKQTEGKIVTARITGHSETQLVV